MSWKIVREFPNERFSKAMCSMQMLGQTRGKRKVAPYQTIPYVEKMIEGLPLEEVEQYHAGLAKLYKWL